MHLFLLYLCVGVPFGLIEFVSVIFIRDGASVWLKGVYGLIAAALWPLIIIVAFVPERNLNQLRSKAEKLCLKLSFKPR